MRLSSATHADAGAIAALRSAAADELTAQHGSGHWSRSSTEKGVLRDIKTSRVLVLRDGKDIVATLRLATKKPWAIDTAYFTPCAKPIYLHDMAVAPRSQRKGIGLRFVTDALAVARDLPGEAVRLDAYDAAAGAGPFYARCGFREVGRVIYRQTPLVYYELLL